MLIYEHITDITPGRHQLIMSRTKDQGWDQQTLNKNVFNLEDDTPSGSWELTKEEDGKFFNIYLDKHMLVYRLHGTEENSDQYRRMRIWDDYIRLSLLENKPLKEIIREIQTRAETDKDHIYLANKLLHNLNQDHDYSLAKDFLNRIETTVN